MNVSARDDGGVALLDGSDYPLVGEGLIGGRSEKRRIRN